MSSIRKFKNLYYAFILRRIMYDGENLWLTGKQMSQINSLIQKLEKYK